MATTESDSEKPVMMVGIDESEESFYALEWTLDHFFVPYSPNYPFKILLVHAKPPPSSAIGATGPGNLISSLFSLYFLLVNFLFTSV